MALTCFSLSKDDTLACGYPSASSRAQCPGMRDCGCSPIGNVIRNPQRFLLENRNEPMRDIRKGIIIVSHRKGADFTGGRLAGCLPKRIFAGEQVRFGSEGRHSRVGIGFPGFWRRLRRRPPSGRPVFGKAPLRRRAVAGTGAAARGSAAPSRAAAPGAFARPAFSRARRASACAYPRAGSARADGC